MKIWLEFKTMVYDFKLQYNWKPDCLFSFHDKHGNYWNFWKILPKTLFRIDIFPNDMAKVEWCFEYIVNHFSIDKYYITFYLFHCYNFLLVCMTSKVRKIRQIKRTGKRGFLIKIFLLESLSLLIVHLQKSNV